MLDDTKALITELFTTNDYSNIIRPVLDQNDILNIDVTFYLSAIIDFDEQEESLTTAGYLSFSWTDASLVWDPNAHNGTTRLFIPQDNIWKPDISLRNSYSSFKGLAASFFYVWVIYDGSVFWEPFQVLKSTCSVDITYFPYDTQTCTLKFIAWSYTKAEINLLSSSNIYLADYSESSTWELVSSSAKSENTADASVVYTLKLQRKPSFYVLNMIVPVVLLSVLSIFTFVLPVKSGERGSYAVTVFLSLAVFLTIVASEFPKNSDTVSYLAVYLILMISISTAYVLASVMELRLANRDEETEPIGRGYVFVFNVAIFLRCKRSNACRRKVDDSGGKEIDTKEHEEKIKWGDVVDEMDFLLFLIGITATFLVTVILMVTIANNPHRVDNIYADYNFETN